MTRNRMLAAAFAAALALPTAARAQGGVEESHRRSTGQAPRAATPAPQQPAAPGQQTAQAQPGQAQPKAPLTDEQRAAFGTVWSRNKLALQLGELASTRGASAEVKNLGRWLTQEHKRVESELAWLLKNRGTDVNTLASGPERQRIEGELAQLNTKSGEELDREVVSFLTKNNPSLVDALKRARDVTPGKDAELKKWLDDAENVAEGHLSAARQLKSQRQARTPPPR